MDPSQRLQLQKMVDASEAEDNTEKIREVKHSSLIEADVRTMEALKRSHGRLAVTDPDQFDALCSSRCSFLFSNYTDLYNRLRKNELNLDILGHFLVVLRKVEAGEVDQHEASVQIGTILKELYIDSALKKSEHLDEKNAEEGKEEKNTGRKLTWKEYAAIYLTK
jgi:hypothetical protein